MLALRSIYLLKLVNIYTYLWMSLNPFNKWIFVSCTFKPISYKIKRTLSCIPFDYCNHIWINFQESCFLWFCGMMVVLCLRIYICQNRSWKLNYLYVKLELKANYLHIPSARGMDVQIVPLTKGLAKSQAWWFWRVIKDLLLAQLALV